MMFRRQTRLDLWMHNFGHARTAISEVKNHTLRTSGEYESRDGPTRAAHFQQMLDMPVGLLVEERPT